MPRQFALSRRTSWLRHRCFGVIHRSFGGVRSTWYVEIMQTVWVIDSDTCKTINTNYPPQAIVAKQRWAKHLSRQDNGLSLDYTGVTNLTSVSQALEPPRHNKSCCGSSPTEVLGVRSGFLHWCAKSTAARSRHIATSLAKAAKC